MDAVPADWESCEHRWGPAEDVRDAQFLVKFGEVRTCNSCGARLYDDWCARAGEGSERSILPPSKVAEDE